LSFKVSHPSLEKSEGWGTQLCGIGQDFKNLGCATRLQTASGKMIFGKMEENGKLPATGPELAH